METEQATHHVRHDPAGVCAITPWNSPLMLSTWKLRPALAAGNSCVLKAPGGRRCPRRSSRMRPTRPDAAGVFNLLQGAGASTGAALVADPRLSRNSFTGSTATGKTIGQLAMGNLVPCSLELGGKSPFIVLEDADLDLAARTAALMYRNATQVCLAGTRLLVHASVRDAFVERMRGCVEQLAVGDPRDAATEVGPLIHPRQYARVEAFVQAALDSGARALWGAHGHDFGDLYYAPTSSPTSHRTTRSCRRCSARFWYCRPSTLTGKRSRWRTTPATASRACASVRLRMRRPSPSGPYRIHLGEFVRHSRSRGALRRLRESGIGREGGDWSFEFFSDVKDVIVPKKAFAGLAHR